MKLLLRGHDPAIAIPAPENLGGRPTYPTEASIPAGEAAPVADPLRKRFGSARVRILACVLLLLVVAGGATLFVQREVLVDELEAEVESSLVQEVEEIRVLAAGRDPTTGLPFDGNVSAIFDTFLRRNIPHDSETLLAIVAGAVYKETQGPLVPKALGSNPEFVSRVTGITTPQRGQIATSSGTVRYMAVPLSSRSETAGVFVVADFLEPELDEIDRITQVGALVYGSVLVLVIALAWILAGRVLRPVREVTEAAKHLTSSDLSKRIAVPESEDEITELARTFNLMLDRLDGAFRQQREFLDDASHELRTPITIIRGYLELEGLDASEHRVTREVIRDELDRMARIVDDLLVLARAEQPEFIEHAALDLDLLTLDLLPKAQALADRDWRLVSTGHGVIIGDRHRLTQAMVNLMENAARLSPPREPIEIGSSIREKHARLWVRDYGPGIEPAERERIFQRFARSSRGRSAGGAAGLGLSIVRAIADAHGGSVELDTELGKGTTFTIIIPIGWEADAWHGF